MGKRHRGPSVLSSSSPIKDEEPLQASTPIKRPSPPISRPPPPTSFFTLVSAAGEERERLVRQESQQDSGHGTGNTSSMCGVSGGGGSTLNTPVQKQEIGENGQVVDIFVERMATPQPRLVNLFLDSQDHRNMNSGDLLPLFQTPKRGGTPARRGGGGGRGGRSSTTAISLALSTPRRHFGREGMENRFMNSPLYCKVDIDTSSEEEDNYAGGGAYGGRLRPRNLFNSGVSIKKYNMYKDNDSDSEDDDDEEGGGKKKDKDDEDVYFFLSEEEEEDIEMEEIVEGHEKKRSSYSGIRGPKADAKALSLVTNCPVSVKWLVDNFEYCPGRSLPRGFVYDQYVLLCNENGLEPVNAASFGKLIRSVFPGLKTRRLGTRGNSKYHYNGVYLKAGSHLMVILNLIKTQQGLSYDGNGKRGRRVRRCFEGAPGRGGGSSGAGSDFFRHRESEDYMDCSPNEYLGKCSESVSFAVLNPEAIVLPPNLDESSVKLFESIYYSHCQTLLIHFENFDLKQVFDEWKRFWRLKCNAPPAGDDVIKYKDVMSKTTLFKVCTLLGVQEYIMCMDLCTYQFIMNILFPCLSKGMPVTMLNALRNFIKDVEFVFHKIMDGFPKTLAELKLRSLRAFINMWNDYSRLNRMLKAAVATIRNEDNITAMHSELCRSINFQDIEAHMALMTKACENLVQDNLIMDFRLKLSHDENGNSRYDVRRWIEWAKNVSLKLIEENARQVREGELCRPGDAFLIWKKASDRILGAIVKGNAVSFGVFKGFLLWCDQLIKHTTRLETASRGPNLHAIFIYESEIEYKC